MTISRTRFLWPTVVAALLVALLLPAPAPIAAQETPQEIALRVVQLTNERRADYGLPPLQVNAGAMAGAQWFAEEMAQYDYISQDHVDRLGRGTAQRATESGYTGWFTLGENLAGMAPTPEQVVAIWMNSAPHRANILNPEFCEIGVGYAENPDGYYRFHWVQVFGCSQAATEPASETEAVPAAEAVDEWSDLGVEPADEPFAVDAGAE